MRRLAPALSAVILTLTASPALAGTLDQSQTGGSTPGGIGSAGAVGTPPQIHHSGQAFTAGLSGALDQADLYLERECASPQDDLSVQIRTVSGNPALPTSTLLATTTVPAASVPLSFGWVTVQFPAPAAVSAGTRYALVAASTGACGVFIGGTPVGAIPGYAWRFASAEPYTGGTRLSSSNAGASWSSLAGEDFAFKTYVVPPPPDPDPDPTGPGTGTGTGSGTGTGTGATTATGQRAAALKKCRKKRGAARRKCKRAASRLPV